MNDSNKWERLRAILEKEYGDWAFSVNSDEEQAKTRVEQENNPCFW